MMKPRQLLCKTLLAVGCLQMVIVLVSGQATGTLCPPVAGSPGCVCNHPDGKIDVTSLANSDGTPKYTGLIDPNSYPYSINPCTPFSGSAECTNVFICQGDPNIDGAFYDIADAGTEQIYIDTDNKVYLYYTTSTRFARIYLECDTSETGTPKWDVKGDSAGVILHYEFTMTHASLCPGASGGGGGGGSADIAGPVGLVLIFLLPVALIAYFVIGAVIMAVKYNAAGSDIIPHKAFWLDLPLLIKDGVMFTFNPCLSAVKNRGYNKA